MIAFSNPLSIIDGSIASSTNYDKIVRDQMIDAITTNQGERVMHPTWGCNIQGMLYDPASSLERNDAASYIRDLLVHMVPRALVMSVLVSVAPDELNKVYIDITYQTSNYSPVSSLSVSVNTAASTAPTTATAGVST